MKRGFIGKVITFTLVYTVTANVWLFLSAYGPIMFSEMFLQFPFLSCSTGSIKNA